jgi:hypothetical protein
MCKICTSSNALIRIRIRVGIDSKRRVVAVAPIQSSPSNVIPGQPTPYATQAFGFGLVMRSPSLYIRLRASDAVSFPLHKVRLARLESMRKTNVKEKRSQLIVFHAVSVSLLLLSSLSPPFILHVFFF